jgi:FkbM family methyltransferase
MKLFLQLTFKQLYHYLTDWKQRQFINIAFKYGNKKRFTNMMVKFNGYRINIVDSLSFVWQYKDIFTEEIYRFDSDSNFSPVIYDCGANVGTSCLFFKKLFPKAVIKAYEADPKIAEILKENLAVNGFNDVEVINKAVWVDNNGIELSTDGADGASVFGQGNKIRIESVRLKEYLEKEEVVHMLKMDIEGVETAVIIDCQDSLQKVQHFFIEYHSFVGQKQGLADILQVLTQNRFRYHIQPIETRKHPFVNREGKNNPLMDMQLNIFAYK